MFNKNYQIESYVKGKIVETLFELMFREDPNKTFTIIPFGYEKTTPELAQYQDLIKNIETLAVIRQSPDFILIKNDKTKVHFVEVKYRQKLDDMTKNDLLNRAKIVSAYWKDTYYFIATQSGFYFDSCKNIVSKNGEINQLNSKIISSQIQEKYFRVLKKFISVKKI